MAGHPQRKVNERSENQRRHNAVNASRQLQAAEQRGENQPQRHHAGQRLIEDFDHRQKAQKQKADAGDRPQKPRRGNVALDPASEKGGHDFDQTDHEEGRHADMPGEDRVARGHKRRAQNGVRDADGGGRVEPQRHGRDVPAAGFARQADGEPRVNEVAQQNADGRAGDHARQDDIHGIVKCEDQNGVKKNENARVVQKQGEKSGRFAPESPVLRRAPPVRHAPCPILRSRLAPPSG